MMMMSTFSWFISTTFIKIAFDNQTTNAYVWLEIWKHNVSAFVT